jgi:aminoglycoside/choline kinase family phosphotransferase
MLITTSVIAAFFNVSILCSISVLSWTLIKGFGVSLVSGIMRSPPQASIDTEFSQFEEQFELMGLQRHLKILGIFKRLSMRDGKHQYLDDLPLVKKYALQIADMRAW